MGAVHEPLLKENQALRNLALEAAGDGRLGDDYMARVIAVLRGPEAAEDFRCCRGEWEGRERRPGGPRPVKTRRARRSKS